MILKVHWTIFSALLPMVPSMPCVMPCSVRRVSVAFADISVWLWQRCWTNLLLKLRDRRRSAPISSFQNEIREGEVTIGVRGDNSTEQSKCWVLYLLGELKLILGLR